jgi:nitrous oxide reductase accessory protein NosL
LAAREKLFAAIRNNPKDVRLDDARKAARWLGFTKEGGAGGHKAFARPGEPIGLNFQADRNGRIPAYQAKQLIVMIDKYGDEGES